MKTRDAANQKKINKKEEMKEKRKSWEESRVPDPSIQSQKALEARVGQDFVHQGPLCKEHPPAAVAVQAKLVEDLGCILSLCDARGVFVLQVGDGFSACETTYWY